MTRPIHSASLEQTSNLLGSQSLPAEEYPQDQNPSQSSFRKTDQKQSRFAALILGLAASCTAEPQDSEADVDLRLASDSAVDSQTPKSVNQELLNRLREKSAADYLPTNPRELNLEYVLLTFIEAGADFTVGADYFDVTNFPGDFKLSIPELGEIALRPSGAIRVYSNDGVLDYIEITNPHLNDEKSEIIHPELKVIEDYQNINVSGYQNYDFDEDFIAEELEFAEEASDLREIDAEKTKLSIAFSPLGVWTLVNYHQPRYVLSPKFDSNEDTPIGFESYLYPSIATPTYYTTELRRKENGEILSNRAREVERFEEVY